MDFSKEKGGRRDVCLLKLLCFICLFCLMPLRVHAAQEQLNSIKDLYVTGFFGDALNEQQIHWQQEDSEYYLCMPSGADLSSVKIWFDGQTTQGASEGYVLVDGAVVENGDVLDLSGSGKERQISLSGGRTIKLNVLQSANIPSVFIATESGNLNAVHASKDYKEAGTMAIVKEDKTIDFNGKLKHIKGRGNATWGYAKKPYNIKLDKSADLLDMGKGKGWCLLANYTDRSLLRNRIVYNLAQETGIPFTMDSRNVDLYINGNYMGSYLLTEKIEIGETRVDIVDLEGATEDVNSAELDTYSRGGSNGWAVGTQKWVNIPNDPEDITGGYLLEVELNDRYSAEVSGFVTTGKQSVVIKYPEYASENQVKYISNLYQEMEEAIYSDTGYNSLGKHFSEYIDVESLARMYVLQEFSMNLDTGITSFYFYKDSDLAGDGKIHAAPVWDFDVALGNYYSRDGVNLTDPTQWWARRAQIYGVGGLNILAKAVSHTEVMEKAAEIWEKEFVPAVKVLLGEETDYTASCLKSLDAYAQEVGPSAAINFVQWRQLMENGTSYGLVNTGTTYEANMEYLESFISRRRDFLNEGLDAILHPPVVEIGENTLFKASENIISSSILQAETTTDEGGGQNLGYCDAGAYAEYRIQVQNTGSYDVAARIASNQGGGAFRLVVDGQTLAVFEAVRTGGWQNWVTLDAKKITLSKGEHKLRIEYTESGSNLNWLQFTLTEKEEPVQNEINREKLKELYNVYKELDTSLYTTQSVDLFREALAEAEKILERPEAKSAEVDAVLAKLIGAFGGLEYGVQKLHLEIAIEAAEKILEQSDLYGDVTELTTAVKEGRVIAELASVSQEEVDEAAYRVLEELSKLKLDKTFLKNLLEEAEILADSGKYTNDSVEALREVIEEGREVLADPASGADAVNDVCARLVYAISGLRMENNKAALKAMINKAEEVLANKDSYVEATLAGLEDIFLEAKAVYADESASQRIIDEVTRKLTEALAEVRLIGDVNGDGIVNTSDSVEILRASVEVVELNAEQQICADTNGDGRVDTTDASIVLKYASEVIDTF